MKAIRVLVILGSLVSAVPSFAYLERKAVPVCLDGSTRKVADNKEVLNWKANTKNQFKARAYAQGKVVQTPVLKGEHYRFIISIGTGPKDLLEVVYNSNFGQMPNMYAGDEISVCGDFINAFAKAGHYEASPAGAIIHWVHYNPGTRPGDHEHGFILHRGVNLIGFDEAPAEAWNGRVVRNGAPQEDARRSERGQRERDRSQGDRPGRSQAERNQRERNERERNQRERDQRELPEICRRVAGRCN